MGWKDWGNTPINSTGTPQSGPSTGTLLAELDSSQLGTMNYTISQQANFAVTWIVGADTNVTWQLESCNSTALGAGVDIIFPKTATGQSGQFMTTHRLGKDYRLRARLFSTGANASAYISAEPLT